MQEILALVLAGGRVDELRTLTKYRPKSAVPFAGKYRIIDFPLSNLMHSRIGTVGVLSQYRSSPLINHILDGRSWDLWGRNRLLQLLPPFKGEKDSDWYNGTVDAVHQNIDFINTIEPKLVLMISGDHIYKMDYSEIVKYHQKKNADLTIGFIKIDPHQSHRFGVAEIDEEDGVIGGKIVNYFEKPSKQKCDWASLTIFVFQTKFLLKCLEMMSPLLRKDEPVEFGRNLIPTLFTEKYKYRIYGYKYSGYWGYTRTLTEFWQANMDLIFRPDQIDLEEWEVRTNLDHRGIRDRIPAIINEGSQITNSLVGNGCVIKGEVKNSILSPGVVVEKGAKVHNSIVMFDTKIGGNVFLNNVILDVDIKVAQNVSIGNENDLSANPEELQVFGEGERIG